MGTKNNPGVFDCYAAADPDEEMFILLARDGDAPSRVIAWAERRLMRAHQLDLDGDREGARKQRDKAFEATTCAARMHAQHVEVREALRRGCTIAELRAQLAEETGAAGDAQREKIQIGPTDV